MHEVVQSVSAWIVPVLIAGILLVGFARRVDVYEAFIAGAKEGFEIGVRIIPYLVAILVVVGMFRGSGAMDALATLLAPVLEPLGVPVDVLPMAIVRPMSGGAANGIVADVLASSGPDSTAGRMVSVMAGSTETTLYVLAVYFGSVGIRRVRHALAAGLIADAVGMVAAIAVVLLLF